MSFRPLSRDSGQQRPAKGEAAGSQCGRRAPLPGAAGPRARHVCATVHS